MKPEINREQNKWETNQQKLRFKRKRKQKPEMKRRNWETIGFNKWTLEKTEEKKKRTKKSSMKLSKRNIELDYVFFFFSCFALVYRTHDEVELNTGQRKRERER